jgi:uncharacterized protein YdhG (YjbR/CyaY superfamily)
MANPPRTIDEYIATAAPKARPLLKRIRQTVRRAVPDVEEVISYRMPAFRLGKILMYVGAFKDHIGVFPPFSGDAEIERAIAPYKGPKGNLRLPFGEPLPYALLERIVTHRADRARSGKPAR